MNKVRLLAVWLLLALGVASAQSGLWTVYFVFGLATTLPVRLEATPECVAERAVWESGAGPVDAPVRRLLETYSFVSPLGADALRQEIKAYAQERDFGVADLLPRSSSPLEGAAGSGTERPVPGQEFQGRAAPGYHYAVRVYERPNGDGSVLCVTVRSDPGTDDADPSLPSND